MINYHKNQLRSSMQAGSNLSVDVFPLFTAANAFMQRLHTRLDVTGEDAIQVDLFATSTNYLITQLHTQTVIN